jgi:hypothetical protein
VVTVTTALSPDGRERQEMADAGPIDPKREQAIAALLVERTIGTAAERVGIGERTLSRWLADPDFRAEYQAASRRVLDGTIGRLRAASGEMLDVLVELTRTADSDSVRRAAARDVLDLSHRFETDELGLRVDKLEAAQNATYAKTS